MKIADTQSACSLRINSTMPHNQVTTVIVAHRLIRTQVCPSDVIIAGMKSYRYPGLDPVLLCLVSLFVYLSVLHAGQ